MTEGDPERTRAWARAAELAYVGGLALGLVILVVFGFIALRDTVAARNDFTYAWAGARAFVDGGSPYETASWLATVRQYQTTPVGDAVFGYPPWVALGLAPLALLPVAMASGVWTYGGMLLAALGVRSLLRSVAPGAPVVHFCAGLALFASQPGTANVWTGQWSFLLVAALSVTVVAVRERRPAGLLAAPALLGKPQLVVLALPALVRAARALWGPRFAGLFVLPLLVAVAAGWLAFPGWLQAWSAGVPLKISSATLGAAELTAERVATQPPTTLANGLADLVGPAGPVIAAALVLGLVAAGLAFHPRSDAFLAVWLAISFATPLYSFSYDHLTLIVPLVIAAAVAARRSSRRGTLVAAAGFGFFLIVPSLLYGVADARRNESFSAFVPLGVALLCL
ncbi:MAG: glycosyltransferase 87 family protein, partial [Candidatus Limnocylindria bacterium]